MGAVGLGLMGDPHAPDHAANLAALQKRQIERDFRDSGGKADHQKAPFPRDAAQRRFAIIAADRVEDDVRSVGPDPSLERSAQGLAGTIIERTGRIDQAFVRARRSGGRGLVLRRHRSDDPRPQCLADFHRCQSDPAGGAEHEQGLARLEPAAIDQCMDRGAVGQEQCRAFGKTAAGGQADRLALVDHDLFRQPAIEIRGDQLVARRPTGDSFADRFDLAGDLAARRERARRLQLIFVLDDEDVGIIDRAGAHPDQQLTRPGDRIGHIVEAERLGTARSMGTKRFHPVLSSNEAPANSAALAKGI